MKEPYCWLEKMISCLLYTSSIRTFDIESQRSIEELERVLVYPATEMVLTKQQIADGREAVSYTHLDVYKRQVLAAQCAPD